MGMTEEKSSGKGGAEFWSTAQRAGTAENGQRVARSESAEADTVKTTGRAPDENVIPAPLKDS